MISRKEAKQDAKNQLRGQWGVAVGAFFVIGLISLGVGLVTTFIPLLGGIISISLTGIITLGMCAFSLYFAQGLVPRFEQIFEGFTQFTKAIGGIWWMQLWLFIWTLPMVLSMIFIPFMIFMNKTLLTLLLILMVLLSIPVLIKTLSYSMMFFILVDRPDLGVREALAESKAITEGSKWQLFVTDLSFIGWGILSALTLGVGLLWLIPYKKITMANIYEQIKNQTIIAEEILEDKEELL